MRLLVLFGAALFLATELLGAFHQIRLGPLIVWWLVVAAAMVAMVRRQRFRSFRFDWVVGLCVAGIAVILILTAVTAAFSPPNSADGMAYHMPRVVYWAEQGSVRYFPTPYFNQIMLQPMAEYLMLQTYVLSGGDRFINFVQWFASLASVVGVAAVAKALGAGSRGQAMAALFCATLPAGILASSGAKNDYFLAMWLVAAVWFALQVAREGRFSDALWLGGALGFALLTKATAYLFAPFLVTALPIAAVSTAGGRVSLKRVAMLAVMAIGVALGINAPQYVRNYQLSGSVMGFDSAQGDGVYRWRNENFGWRETASNVMRNLADQMGARSSVWNQGVYSLVLAAHRGLGIDVNDPATTWHGSSYGPPVNANHEANAPNRWQLAILFVVGCVLAWRRDSVSSLYGVGLICAFIAFCGYLKWQPFFARLLLPLFVLGAPLVGVVVERNRVWMQVALCVFLLSNARYAVLENWVRPLKGPRSVLHVSRDMQYFADMTQWDNRESYLKTVDLLARSDCNTVGTDITDFQLEYPLQALLRERSPHVEFVHAGVTNASRRYAPSIAAAPCAIVCLECAGDDKRLSLYADFGVRVAAGRFIVLLRQR